MNVRAELIDAALLRRVVAVESDHEGERCVAVGAAAKVSKTHVTVRIKDTDPAYIPIAAITNVSHIEQPQEHVT